MSVSVTLGSQTFDLPIQNDNSGWGDSTTDFMVAVAALLNTSAPAGSIPLTSASILGSQTDANVTNFTFSSTICKGFKAIYRVTRASSGNELGEINGIFNGTNWQITGPINVIGDAQITMACPTGATCQIQYTTTNADAGTIYFRTLAVFLA